MPGVTVPCLCACAQHAPSECARLFEERVTAYMDLFINGGYGVLPATDSVIRYDIQGRG